MQNPIQLLWMVYGWCCKGCIYDGRFQSKVNENVCCTMRMIAMWHKSYIMLLMPELGVCWGTGGKPGATFIRTNEQKEPKVSVTRAISHTSQGPWPCNGEDSSFSSKGRATDMTAIILHHTYLLEMGFMQISVYPETSFMLCHAWIHVDDFSSMTICLGC